MRLEGALCGTVTIVPTQQTRRTAQLLIEALEAESGYDATLRLSGQVEAGQWPALVAVLLSTGRLGGRPAMRPIDFTDGERRRLHSRYVMGERTPEVVAGEREYQRLHKRMRRAAS